MGCGVWGLAADAGGLQLYEWGAGAGGGGVFADEQLSFADGQDGSLQPWFGIDECEEVLEFGCVGDGVIAHDDSEFHRISEQWPPAGVLRAVGIEEHEVPGVWVCVAEELASVGGVQSDGVCESCAAEVLACDLVFFGGVIDGVDGNVCGCCSAEQPECGVGAGGADFEDAFGALFLNEEFEEASGGGGDIEHLLCAHGVGSVMAGAVLMNFGEQSIEFGGIGGYWVHGGH